MKTNTIEKQRLENLIYPDISGRQVEEGRLDCTADLALKSIIHITWNSRIWTVVVLI